MGNKDNRNNKHSTHDKDDEHDKSNKNDKNTTNIKKNTSDKKTRITSDMSDEKDVIAVEDQTDVSSLIEDKFDAFNLVPPDIGTTVDLTHIGDTKTRELVESLISAHDKAFSANK